MGMRAAEEDSVKLALGLLVGDIAPAPRDEAQILAPEHGLADSEGDLARGHHIFAGGRSRAGVQEHELTLRPSEALTAMSDTLVHRRQLAQQTPWRADVRSRLAPERWHIKSRFSATAIRLSEAAHNRGW